MDRVLSSLILLLFVSHPEFDPRLALFLCHDFRGIFDCGSFDFQGLPLFYCVQKRGDNFSDS